MCREIVKTSGQYSYFLIVPFWEKPMLNQKKYSFNFTHADIEFAGTICYSAKDWSFTLDKPLEKSFGGGHLMYAVPAIYTVLENDADMERINGVIHFNLLPRVKQRCVNGYANGWQSTCSNRQSEG